MKGLYDYFYSWLVALATLQDYSTVSPNQEESSTNFRWKGQGDLVGATELSMEHNTSGVNIVRSELLTGQSHCLEF